MRTWLPVSAAGKGESTWSVLTFRCLHNTTSQGRHGIIWTINYALYYPWIKLRNVALHCEFFFLYFLNWFFCSCATTGYFFTVRRQGIFISIFKKNLMISLHENHIWAIFLIISIVSETLNMFYNVTSITLYGLILNEWYMQSNHL